MQGAVAESANSLWQQSWKEADSGIGKYCCCQERFYFLFILTIKCTLGISLCLIL